MELYLKSKSDFIHIHHDGLVWVIDNYDRRNLKKTSRMDMIGSDEMDSLINKTTDMSIDEIAKILLSSRGTT